MRRLTLFVFILVAGLLIAGGVFLLTWDIPPPSTPVEKVLPDERFPR